ncbi:hypothetical protein [Daejeonella oryzae]|uniref:hypothetical protein n=1 Tax=Daejeonella oryzae TaxID=1122943 RepID=UPI0003F965E0|nr:hypothetical protein [Daejeonella oryzae]
MNLIKLQLYELCNTYINERIKTAENAIEAARESANDDTKSSAGDKYETGREMMQQEINRNTLQLHEARKLQQILQSINPEHSAGFIRNGSLVITNHGNFYISISAGHLVIDGTDYFAVSTSSPIGAILIKSGLGDTFDFNGKKFTVLDIL